MKAPGDCKNKDEIRNEIDRIDHEIIKLLGIRFQFVKEIVKYKLPDKDSIVAKNRYNQVIAERRRLAEKNGLSPDTIEEMYKILIEYFINEEIKIINNNNNNK